MTTASTKSVVIQELEELVPSVIGMLPVVDSSEMAIVATLIEALGNALSKEAGARNFDAATAIIAADAAAMTAPLRLRFPNSK